MKRLTSADNLLVATLWQRILASAGIESTLRNRFIGAAFGELPADQVLPELWVSERDYGVARQIIAEVRQESPLPAWRCGSCDEAVEGQFFQCWQCQAQRP